MYSGHSCRDRINFCGLLVGDLLLDITNEASNRIGIPGFPSPATSSDANEALPIMNQQLYPNQQRRSSQHAIVDRFPPF